jgi:hypothetical protein
LDHEFFSDVPQNTEEAIDINLTHLKELKQNAQNGFD